MFIAVAHWFSSLLIHNQAYLCHFPSENSQNVYFVLSFKRQHIRKCMLKQAISFNSRVHQQEPMQNTSLIFHMNKTSKYYHKRTYTKDQQISIYNL